MVRRDVGYACLVVFLADVVSGILSPTFSVFAQSLGASLSVIGALGSAVGLAQIAASVPIGYLSDRVGRKTVLSLGMAGWAAATVLVAVARQPSFLFPARVLHGVCWVATFAMAIAYLGDVVSPEESGLAFGVFATAMGIGFAVGPLVGATVIAWRGLRASYLVAAAVALGGSGLAAVALRHVPPSRAVAATRSVLQEWRSLPRILRDPSLRIAGLSNLLVNVAFSAAIVNFFPLYAAQLRVPQAATNSMFSARAVGSTMARFPAGLLINRFSGRIVIAGAFALLTAVLFSLARTQRVPLLALLLVLEGMAFGVILTSAQALTAQTAAVSRGTAIGLYSMAGSIGNGFGPLILGLVAETWGVQRVFLFTGVLTLAGLLAILGRGPRG